jgi:molecular chaperone DnaJ
MSKADLYQTLGVDRDADEKSLKSAFRKKAMEFHPDRNPGDAEAEQHFKEVNQAYDILKDPQKRAAYDQFGHAAFEGGGQGGGSPFGGGGGGGGFEFNFGSFGDIFEEFFGEGGGGGRGRRQREQAARGQDMRYNLEISLEEAFTGKQTTIRVPTSVECDACTGSGAEGGAQPTQCPTCQGRGRTRASQGFFTVERTCHVCQGTGQIIENPCKTCSGSGRQHREKTLSVNVPAGVDDGTRIRLAGEGEAGMRGAASGDLYIFVTVAPHDIFQRDEAHIFCSVPIPMTRAALGGQIEVPTVEGTRAKVTIPAGTQTGDRFRLRGKGMSVLRSAARGDMYIEVEVETPRKLSKRQRELLEEFQNEGGDETAENSKRFFSKVRSMFEGIKD